MKLLGLDHIGIVVRNIDKTVARAGDTVDGRAVGERFSESFAPRQRCTFLAVSGRLSTFLQ